MADLRGVVILVTGLLAAQPIVAAGGTSGPAKPGGAAADTSRSMLTPGAYTSSEICAGCHKDIYTGWSTSAHGTSYSDAAFTSALAGLKTAGKDAKACLGCHAPTTLAGGTGAAAEALMKEGITCSFCHSITATASEWGPKAITNDPGQTMRGPFQYASSPGHLTAFSPLHKTAQLCAPCHQFRTASGVAVLNTFEEWKAGPWPGRGVQCQDCHMAPVPGAVADDIQKPALPAAQDRRLINLHHLVGGSALGQLRRSLTANIKETKRNQGMIAIEVEVRNDGAGHRAPTGLPTRSIVLRLEASKAGQPVQTDQRVYRRELLDGAGKPILTDSDAFTSAARIGVDTRLGPGESRIERFSFPAPPGTVKVVFGLDYEVSQGAGKPPKRERFQEITTEVK